MNEVLTSQQLASKTRANQDAFFDSIVALTNQQLASKTYYQTHKEICKARVAKWLKKNRKQWNRYMRARMRLLYEQRPEEWKAYCDKNKKKIRGYQKKWRMKNRERLRAYNRRRYYQNRNFRMMESLTYEI